MDCILLLNPPLMDFSRFFPEELRVNARVNTGENAWSTVWSPSEDTNTRCEAAEV